MSLNESYSKRIALLVILLTVYAYPVWGYGFGLPKVNKEHLGVITDPAEGMIFEVINEDETSQLMGFVDGKWRPAEEVAQIFKNRRQLIEDFTKTAIRSSILLDYRICPICLETLKTDAELIQHLCQELIRKTTNELDKPPTDCIILAIQVKEHGKGIPQLTLAELEKIPKEIIKEGSIVWVDETEKSLFRIFHNGRWEPK